jgi:hypothetical protein
MTPEVDDAHSHPSRSALRIGLWMFVAVIGFFLWTEHRAHLFGALPYILLLLCPAMHLFMHHGHRHTHDHGAEP